MKHIKYTLFAALVTLSLSCAQKIRENATSASKNPLRIMSYNVHHFNPPSRAADSLIDIDAVANVIKAEKPDLIALQEIDISIKRSGNIDQAKLLSEKTGMDYRFFKAIDHEGGDYGIMILSKFPFSDVKKIDLPEAEAYPGEHRVMAYMTVKLPSGKTFVFANTHMDAQKNDATRTVQMKAILNELSTKKGPVVLCGDFNSVDTSEAIRLLDEQFMRTCTQNCPGTVPQVNPRKTIDYIAIKNAPDWQIESYRVIPETYASDHRPVVATFKINQ